MTDYKATLLQLLKDSYILRFTVVVILTIVVCYMYINGQSVPNELYTVWVALLGYGLGILNEKALNTTAPKDQ